MALGSVFIDLRMMFVVLCTLLIYVASTEKQGSYISSDGISDCHILCNPPNGYTQSCKRYCKGFKHTDSDVKETLSSHFPWPIILCAYCPVIAAIAGVTLFCSYRAVMKIRRNLFHFR